MELQEKAFLLKKYEPFCYRAAFFLLECEQDAIRAAGDALVELGRDDRFLTEPETLQLQKAKAAVVRHSLLTRSRVRAKS